MDKSKIKDIFIDEAKEIIEQLSIDIVNYESSKDEELLNAIFRGAHTIKGSAATFGFAQLGEFAHKYEDILSCYRKFDLDKQTPDIDLMLESVDMLKSIFKNTMEQNETPPKNYKELLEKLELAVQTIENSEIQDTESEITDLSKEFGESIIQADSDNIQLLEKLQDDESLYVVTMTADNDIYLRGNDHVLIYNYFLKHGRILSSYWDTSTIPKLSELDPAKSYFGTMKVFIASSQKIEILEEIFDFFEKNEYDIAKIDRYIAQEEKVLEQKSETKEKEEQIETTSFIRIATNKLNELFDMVGELVIAQNQLMENKKISSLKDADVNKTIESLFKTTHHIQDRVMKLRMVPLQDTFEKMKRVVRDTKKATNKDISLHIKGEKTEVDKMMVDALFDPLVHLVRNAIDHGIQTEGNIFLNAYHKAGSVYIEVEDDGIGLDKDKIIKKIRDEGLLNKSEIEELNESQTYQQLLKAGFTMSKKVSNISGRGVGLDVVNTFVKTNRGRVEIISKKDEGSLFRIILPLTLAIIDGIIVKSSQQLFIVPTLSIYESFQPKKEAIHTIKEKGEFVSLREEILPVVRLNNILEIDKNNLDMDKAILMVCDGEKGRFALLVDEILGRQHIVIKPIGRFIKYSKEFSGGAVLGNGEVVLVLSIGNFY